MNKTVTVNIGGIVFHIDENAYERFKQYLESIRSHFTASEGRDEIMQDIEARIAEMFQERIKDGKEVVTLTDVDDVTELMGKPEQFGEEKNEEEPKEPKATSQESREKIKRRLFRNPDDKLLGGVCSGIASYFDIDPVWVRLAFVGVVFLPLHISSVVVYLILWIIVPVAITTADKLQMKGEPVTISNIEKNVQEEIEHVKKKFNEMNKDQGVKNLISRFFELIITIFKTIFKAIGKIFAVVFVLIGVLVVFLIFAFILAALKFPGMQYPEVWNQIFPGGFQFGLAVICAMLVVGIPFIMLAYIGLRNLANIRQSTRVLTMTAFGIWFVALIICTTLGLSIAKEYKEKQSIRKEINLTKPSGKTISLKMNGSNPTKKDYDRWDDDEWNGDLHLSVNDGQLQSRDLHLDIVKSENDSLYITQISYARGASKKVAADNASNISYSFSQSDSILNFNSFFIIDKNEKYRAQKIQLILHVPVGRKIYFDPSIRQMIWDIENVDNILDNDMVKKNWEMTEDGLKCLDCTGEESTIGRHKKHGVHYFNNGKVEINEDGVYIEGENGESVTVDSNGVNIHKKK